MSSPLVNQYGVKAGKLTSRPSQRIYIQATCPDLNKIPFQLFQLFADHKTNSYITNHALMPKRKQTRTLPDFGSCFVKRTSRRPEPRSLRRYRRQPETTPLLVAQPPSWRLECAAY